MDQNSKSQVNNCIVRPTPDLALVPKSEIDARYDRPPQQASAEFENTPAPTPAFVTRTFHVVAGGDPALELVSMLTQVMSAYRDSTTSAQRQAANWWLGEVCK